MNQLPLNIDWHQIVLHLFNFMILVLGLYLLLYKPVKSFMEKRENHYRQLEQDTKKALDNAKIVESEWNKKMAKIQEEKQHQIDEMDKKFKEEQLLIQKQTEAKCNSMIKEAQELATQEKNKILHQAKSEVANIAIEAVQKLLDSEKNDSIDSMLN